MSLKKITLALSITAVFGLLACSDDSNSSLPEEKEFVPSADDPVTCSFQETEEGFKMTVNLAEGEVQTIQGTRGGSSSLLKCEVVTYTEIINEDATYETQYCKNTYFDREMKFYQTICDSVDGKKRTDYETYKSSVKDNITCEIKDSTDSHYLQEVNEFDLITKTEYTLSGDTVTSLITSTYDEGNAPTDCSAESQKESVKVTCEDGLMTKTVTDVNEEKALKEFETFAKASALICKEY